MRHAFVQPRIPHVIHHKRWPGNQHLQLRCLGCVDYTGRPNKKETGTIMPVSFKLHKHLNIFWHYLLVGYLLFPMAPRNVGSVMSVNEHEHGRRKQGGLGRPNNLLIRGVGHLPAQIIKIMPKIEKVSDAATDTDV